MADVPDFGLKICGFEIQSSYDIHTQTNTQGKVIEHSYL